MYSIKFAAKLVKIKKLCKNKVEKLMIFMVLSTYYLTFRFVLLSTFCNFAKIRRISLYKGNAED